MSNNISQIERKCDLREIRCPAGTDGRIARPEGGGLVGGKQSCCLRPEGKASLPFGPLSQSRRWPCPLGHLSQKRAGTGFPKWHRFIRKHVRMHLAKGWPKRP